MALDEMLVFQPFMFDEFFEFLRAFFAAVVDMLLVSRDLSVGVL